MPVDREIKTEIPANNGRNPPSPSAHSKAHAKRAAVDYPDEPRAEVAGYPRAQLSPSGAFPTVRGM